MSDYPMLISNKLHSFRNFIIQIYNISKEMSSVSVVILVYPIFRKKQLDEH